MQQNLERDMESCLQQALEPAVLLHKFPKAAVDVYVLVLESGGSDLAVAITAASLALADAGIEMCDLTPACSVVSVAGSGSLRPAHVPDRGIWALSPKF